MPPGLAQALRPVVEQIAEMTFKIKQYDRQIQQLGQTQYPETQALLKVHGVGHLTALTFVLTLGSKERFKQSRNVDRKSTRLNSSHLAVSRMPSSA